MALYATNRFPGDGVTTSYEFNFVGKYFARSHVKAYQEDNATNARTPVDITDSNFLNDTTLHMLPVTPVGKTLVIYRDTPKAPLVDFVNGSRLTEYNLDTATRQGSFIAAEGLDALSPSGLAGVMNYFDGLASAAGVSSSEAAAASAKAGVYAGQAAVSAASVLGSEEATATYAHAAMSSKNLADAAASSASLSAAAASQDAATVAANTATATTAAAGAVTAVAQATALLGVGIGTSYVDPEGDLIMTYVPPVTSVYIDGDGNLSLEY